MIDESKKGLFIGAAIAGLVVAIGIIIFVVSRSGGNASAVPIGATPPPNAQKMMLEMSKKGPGMQGGGANNYRRYGSSGGMSGGGMQGGMSGGGGYPPR